MPPGMRRLGAVHKGRAEKFFKIPDSMIESYRQEAGKLCRYSPNNQERFGHGKTQKEQVEDS